MNTYQTFLLYAILYRLAIIGSGIVCIIVGYKLFVKNIPSYTTRDESSDLNAEFKGAKLTLKNAAPGTFFSLFGTVLIGLMIIQGSPELVFENMNNMSLTDSENDIPGVESISDSTLDKKINQISFDLIDQVNSDLNKKLASQEEQFSEQLSRMKITLRSSDQSSKSIISITEKARALEDEGRIADATVEYKRAIFCIADPMNALAWLYFQNNELEKAYPIAKYAVDLVPEEPNFLETKAEILFALGNHDEAIEVIEKAARLDGKYRKNLDRFKSELNN